MAVTSEYEHAERIVGEVAVLSDMVAGRLDEDGVRQAAQVLLNHRRTELPAFRSRSPPACWMCRGPRSKRGVAKASSRPPSGAGRAPPA